MAYSGVGFLGWIGLGIVGFILYKEHEMVNRDFNNIPKAFFELNSYIGIIYFIMIVLDKA
jgi:4-hydroxybenzoate polyprenyltransferase